MMMREKAYTPIQTNRPTGGESCGDLRSSPEFGRNADHSRL
jgi:hypothetical protein